MFNTTQLKMCIIENLSYYIFFIDMQIEDTRRIDHRFDFWILFHDIQIRYFFILNS